MHPILFKIPFTDHMTVKSYGLMMVIGFMAAVWLIRRLSRNITPDSQLITSAALYSLIAGVLGARLFFVVHYFDRFSGNLASMFAIWEGGLELLGGVFFALTVIILYLRYHKLPVRHYLDILAVGLMLALGFGRVGCFLNGCCFGKPADVAWAVRFPYGSFAYQSQIYWNPQRGRVTPQLELPADFSIYNHTENGIAPGELKPLAALTEVQKEMVSSGKYRCLAVHPTQLYSSANGFLCCFLLYLFWRRSQNAEKAGKKKMFTGSGSIFCLMLIFYGIARFFIEFLRDDNPFEFDGITISQNISIGMILLGLSLAVIFAKMKPEKIQPMNSDSAD